MNLDKSATTYSEEDFPPVFCEASFRAAKALIFKEKLFRYTHRVKVIKKPYDKNIPKPAFDKMGKLEWQKHGSIEVSLICDFKKKII